MHSIWMIPNTSGQAELRRLISTLSTYLDSPVFEPHITVLADLPESSTELILRCSQIFADCNRYRAHVKGVGGNEEFYTSFFLDLDVPSSLGAFREKLAATLNVSSPSPFRPHISVAYGAISSAKRLALTQQLVTGTTRTSFEIAAVEVVRASKQTPVKDWHAVWRQELK